MRATTPSFRVRRAGDFEARAKRPGADAHGGLLSTRVDQTLDGNDKVLAIGEARRGSCPKRPKIDDGREARIVEEVPAHPTIGLIDLPATPAVRALHGSAE